MTAHAASGDAGDRIANAPSALHCGQLFDSRSGKVLGPHTVLVQGNPVEDINRVLDVAFVMKDGVIYKQPDA